MANTRTKYDTIGMGYDTTRRADPRIAAALVRLLDPKPGGFYLDVACGTGNYTRAVKALGVDIAGIDQSETMLVAAREKAPEIAWHRGHVVAQPFGASCFAGAICTLAIHHFSDHAAAFREVARVVETGGRFVVLTSTPEQMRSYWLCHYFPEALRRSADQMVSVSDMAELLDRAGLAIEVIEPWSIPKDPIDLFLYSGKHDPRLYLDPSVRRGISTFANLADPAEVSAGVAKLDADIASGAIAGVMSRYENDAGDYVFVAARKR